MSHRGGGGLRGSGKSKKCQVLFKWHVLASNGQSRAVLGSKDKNFNFPKLSVTSQSGLEKIESW